MKFADAEPLHLSYASACASCWSRHDDVASDPPAGMWSDLEDDPQLHGAQHTIDMPPAADALPRACRCPWPLAYPCHLSTTWKPAFSAKCGLRNDRHDPFQLRAVAIALACALSLELVSCRRGRRTDHALTTRRRSRVRIGPGKSAHDHATRTTKRWTMSTNTAQPTAHNEHSTGSLRHGHPPDVARISRPRPRACPIPVIRPPNAPPHSKPRRHVMHAVDSLLGRLTALSVGHR